MSERLMWVEKYRPKRLDEVIDQREIVEGIKRMLVDPSEMPHLLFAGPPGTGKTTTALCIARQIYGYSWRNHTLELNASDERRLRDIRSKVKTFSQFFDRTLKIPFKLVILDEADMMRPDAQTALRRIMETAAQNARFILICNYLSKIISPIQSRCAVFKFKRLERKIVANFLAKICENENLECEKEALNDIYDITGGDLRSALNLLQSVSSLKKKLTSEVVREITGGISRNIMKDVIQVLLKEGYATARTKLFGYMTILGLSGYDVIRLTMDELDAEDKINPRIAEIIATYDFRLAEGGSDEIQLSALLAALSKELKGNVG